MFNGKIYYKMAIFNSYVKLPEGIFRYTSLHSTVTSSSHGHKIAATKINPSLVPLYPRDMFIKFVCHPLYIQLCPGYIPISCYISHLSPLYPPDSASMFDFYTPVILGVSENRLNP